MKEQANKNNREVDKLMESYYSLIGSAHVNNIIGQQDSFKVEIDEISTSNELDLWFNSFLKDSKKREMSIQFKKRMMSISKRAAIILVLVISSLTVLTVTVEAVRVVVYDFIYKVNEKFTSINVSKFDDVKSEVHHDDDLNGDCFQVDEEHTLYYVPEGFVLNSSSVDDTMIYLEFTDEISRIGFNQFPLDSSFVIDTENAEVNDIYINSNQGLSSSKEGVNIVFWVQDDKSYLINSTIEIEELIKMAESLK